MTDYREILRLRDLQYSQRAIARSVRCSRNTVEKVLAVSAQLLQKSPSQPHLHAVLAPPCRSFSPTFTH